ncbi:MAG: CDP-glucose 4,6-dehydratase [Desulfosporosinus sp.]|nr:CDP-glucose 4,6-dehydratase [Desulfosporosinus sp.]
MRGIQQSKMARFYQGKRVFVTGHTGFKGSWLTLWLHLMGAEVHGYALEPLSEPSLFKVLELQQKITHVVGDIRDYDKLKGLIKRFQPEIIFHLAAQPLVRLSYAEPRMTYETNVMGTVNVLEAARSTPSTRVLVNITSDKCYENKEWDYAYRENDPLGGYDPYSSSKGCAELVAAAYRSSYFTSESGLRLASVRAGNVIGGGDWAVDRIIPDIVRTLVLDKPVQVRNPDAVRPWQYVLEPLSGYLWLAYQLWQVGVVYDGAWNFGPPSRSNIPVRQVVDQALRTWGRGEWTDAECSGLKLHEAGVLKLDCSKANNLLHWEPVLDVEETIVRTVRWYFDYYHGHDPKGMWARTVAEIQFYAERARTKTISWAGVE